MHPPTIEVEREKREEMEYIEKGASGDYEVRSRFNLHSENEKSLGSLRIRLDW